MKQLITISMLLSMVLQVSEAQVMKELYFSLGFRTPKQEEARQVDYEIKAGMAFNDYLERLDGLYERENDEYYRGFHLKTYQTRHASQWIQGYSAEIEINEAQNINEQWIYKSLASMSNTEVRVSGRFDRWQFDTLMLGVATQWKLWNNIYYEGSFDTNFKETSITRHNIFAYYHLTPKMSQQFRVLRTAGAGRRNSWKASTKIGYKF